MTLPKVYRNVGERAIATYDYIDIAEGTGVIKFQGFETETVSAGNFDYNLSRNTLISTEIETTSADVSLVVTPGTKLLDLDFDLAQFNLPKIIKGTAYIGTSFAITDTGGAGSANGYMIYKLRKWDGSSETEIASVQSITRTTGASSCERVSLPLTIPKTHFKKGDILRLTIEGWAFESGGDATGKITAAHDPSNSEGTIIISANFQGETFTTKLDVHIPFVIDL